MDQKNLLKSSRAVVFGFLAALILTEFLKVSSLATGAGSTVVALSLVLVSALWLFYMVFDTIVWLASREAPSSSEFKKHASREHALSMLCAFLEFASLIWLYDDVNLVGIVADHAKELAKNAKTSDPDYISLLARFSLNAGAICAVWTAWHLVSITTLPFRERKSKSKEKTESYWNLLRLTAFTILFFVTGSLIASRRLSVGSLSEEALASAVVWLLVSLHIVCNYFCHKEYYKSLEGSVTGWPNDRTLVS